MGFKIVREDGKTDWASIRAVFYCALATWILVVRLIGVDPFDDLFSGAITLSTWIDLVCVVGGYLFIWHIMYPNRPKVSL
jgi:hypothetical protein